MSKRDRSNLFKHLLVLGATGAGLLISFPALAQSTDSSPSETEAPEEFQLSAEGFKILCENFPLNSRCQGGGGEQPSAVPTTPRESLNPGTSIEPSSTPDTPEDTLSPSNVPSEAPTAPEPSDSVAPEKPSGDGLSPEPSGGMDVPQPSLPTVPDSPKPQGLDVPNPKGEREGATEAPAAPSAPSLAPSAPGEAPSTTPQSAPTAPTAPTAPNAAPASGTPAAPAATEVSDAELQKFAKVIPELQEIQQSAQQQVSEAIQSAGLTEDRFRELYTAQQAPSGEQQQPATAATPQEQQAVEQVVTQLETIKSEVQTRREQAVRSQGLEVNRFNEILAAVRQDAGLQQQLQQMLNN
jgi:hypothetical protein